MKYPCDMIRDLLALYVDDVCSAGSRKTVEEHLAECEDCRNWFVAMKEADGFAADRDAEKDAELADSLKQVKGRINKRFRRVVLGAAAAVVAVALGFQVLFSLPLKEVNPADVRVTAEVYPVSDLPWEIRVEGLAPDGFLTAVSWFSPYFLREILWSKGSDSGDTLYVKAFKTTLLHNRSDELTQTLKTMELRELNRIVFVDKNGGETVLWSR